MKEILQPIGHSVKNVQINIFFTFLIICIYSSSTYGQTDDKISTVLIKLNNILLEDKTGTSKFLSILVYKDNIIIYRDDFFTSKYSNQIQVLLETLKKNCNNNQYLSIVGSNHYLNIHMKSIIIENLEKSFDEISKNDEYFQHEFFNLNKYILISK